MKRLLSIHQDNDAESFDEKSIMKKFEELEHFNKTFFPKFSNFTIENKTFKEFIQIGYTAIFIVRMKRFSLYIQPNNDAESFDEKTIMKKFKKLEHFNKTFFPKFSNFTIGNYTFEEIIQIKYTAIFTLNQIFKLHN